MPLHYTVEGEGPAIVASHGFAVATALRLSNWPRICDSQFLMIDRCGHLPHEEHLEAVLAAITRFLKAPPDCYRR